MLTSGEGSSGKDVKQISLGARFNRSTQEGSRLRNALGLRQPTVTI